MGGHLSIDYKFETLIEPVIAHLDKDAHSLNKVTQIINF